MVALDVRARQPKPCRRAKRLRLLAVFLPLLIGLFDARISSAQEAATEKSGSASSGTNGEVESTPTAPPAPTAIAIPEVNTRAETVAKELRELAAATAPQAALAKIENELPKLTEALADRLASTDDELAESPSLDALRNLETRLRALAAPLPDWSSALTDRARGLEEKLVDLDTQKTRWSLTRTEGLASGAPPALLERIDATLAKIEEVRAEAEKRRAEVLTLQSRVSEQEARVAQSLAKLNEARSGVVTGLLVQDASPLWSARFREEVAADLEKGVSGLVSSERRSIPEWARDRVERIAFHTLLTLALVFVFQIARRRVAAQRRENPEIDRGLRVFDHPIASSVLVALLLAPWIYPLAPRALSVVLFALALVPAVVVLRHLLETPLYPFLYALVGFFVVDRLRDLILPLPALERLLFGGQMLLAAGLLFWLLRPSRLNRVPAGMSASRAWRRVGVAGRFAIAGVVLALLAGTAGYQQLARLLANGVFGTAYLGLVTYASVQVVQGLLLLVLQSRQLSGLGMVQHHRPLLERRGQRAVRVAGTLLWALAALANVELSEPILRSASDALSARTEFGSVSLSLGDLAAFAFTIYAAVLLSRLVRFLLSEDVYPRLRLSRGMPYAFSTLLHYAILLLGFFLAVAASGVDLNKFTLLAGAFGVGIGFGLQNVVNNFVSGLILLFERPIQIGDRVELSEVHGEVLGIGIRSSVVRTFDGAEVIVPNGNLLSNSVTNWTLSDRRRRVDVEIGVAYGTDPERVLSLLGEIAGTHPDVLPDPEPQALFMTFGDSSLGFRLRVWLRDFDRTFQVRSELSVAINARLQQEGIEIPFPQRDLHVRSADADLLRSLRREDPGV